MLTPHEHIFIEGPSKSERFSTGSHPIKKNIPERNRVSHSKRLLNKFDEIYKTNHRLKQEREAISLPSRDGIYLEFSGAPGFELVTQSIESRREGIKLLNIREELVGEDIQTKTTVYIPEGKENCFLKKIREYSDFTKHTKSGKPKHAPLVNSIEDVSIAFIESLWTDPIELMPNNETRWCEVWLRIDSKIDFGSQISEFTAVLDGLEIQYRNNILEFVECAVVLLNVNKSNLIEILNQSNQLEELRIGQEVASYWTSSFNLEQSEWVEDLLARLSITDSNVKVCILDSGVNNGHPLIGPLLAKSDCLTVNSSWGTDDRAQIAGSRGHGTLMAGIVGYGNLQGKLESNDEIVIGHKLCSVKILPRVGISNSENWGEYTQQAVLRSRIESPTSALIYCMAVTSDTDIDKGKPSSWSGSVDQLCFGKEDVKKLFIVSGGNIVDNDVFRIYPNGNITSSIQNPAQAWNSLCVGAYTDKIIVQDEDYKDYNPLAPKGGLSPFSTTSVVWDKKWPIKPEVVFEGGNILRTTIDGKDVFCDHEDLQVLTTSKEIISKQFDTICATSSATAQASWFAAQVASKYPGIWPETIRALMVHSACWTDEMKRQFGPLNNKSDYLYLLRICGYGVPSIERAINSFENGVTYIAENEIKPFIKESGSSYQINDMHLFDLPWPKELLLDLEENVKLKVTLSYFIEPSPGQVGWKDKYRYSSYGLRFALNNVGESEEEFRIRINTLAREDGEKPTTVSGSDRWTFGQNRDIGSIHSDIWEGSASEIADCNLIAVFPVGGWWKDRNHLKKGDSKTRYSLVVSIDTPEEEVELYSTVRAMISVPIEISTDI